MAAAVSTYQPTVIYKVTVKATGETFYAAPTSANDGTCYKVAAEHGALTCTCPDATYRKRDCKHIQAVAEVIRLASQRQPAKSAPLSPERAAMTPAQRRETALLYTDDRPFSIYADTPRERRYQTLEDERAACDGYASSDYYQHAYR